MVLLCIQTEASYFPEMGWAYITRCELQTKAYAFVLCKLQFRFQGLTKESIQRCASIVQV